MGLFGPDKMTLTLEKYDYKPGDAIKGTVTLNLTKPIKARKLEVALIGAIMEYIEDHSYGGNDDHGHFDSSGYYAPKTIFYINKITLGDEKNYIEETHRFEINIPLDVHKDEPKFEGKLGSIMNFANKLGGHPPYVEWYVKAQLDVPMKIDVRKSQKISLV